VIVKGHWRQDKIDGKTVLLKLQDIGQIQIMKEKGIQVRGDMRDMFRIPEQLKRLVAD